MSDKTGLIIQAENAADWLNSCLTCEAFSWDADQHEAASEDLQSLRDAIAKAKGQT